MAGQALTARSQRLRIALAIPALVGIFGFGLADLESRGLRLDLSPEQRYTLSDRARKVLDTLPADVRVLAFLRSQDPRNLMIEELLRQVAARSRRVRVDVVDVNRSPALARQYGVDSYGAVVVESEGRRRAFSNPREDVLVAALLQVTRQERKTLGWVMGHGEGDIGVTDRQRGYSTARRALEREAYDVRPISLLNEEVPVEVGVLIIAGPQKDFLPEELATLDRHLQRAGNALVLLDPMRAPELARFLRRYYVDLAQDVAVDPSARLHGGEYTTIQVVIDRSEHAILGPLRAPPLFSLPRSVGVVTGEPGLAASTILLRTSSDGWATSDPAVLTTGTASYVAGRDRRGPVPLGVEVAFRRITAPGDPPTVGRLVVYGNAEFANNLFIEMLGNKDLLVNSVAWLARDPGAVASRPMAQELGVQQFFLSAEDGERVFWRSAVLQPALFAAIGMALVAWRRRR